MQGLLFPRLILGIDAVIVLSLLLFAVGLLTLAVVWQLVKRRRLNKDDLSYDIGKDIGIALLAASIITFSYDRVLDYRNLTDLFGVVFGNDVGEEVVDTTRSAIFQRKLIREHALFTFRIVRDDTLPKEQAIIKADIGYDVYSLESLGTSGYKFVQELEHFHIKGKDKDGKELPRFDSVSSSAVKEPYEGERLQRMVCNGRLEVTDGIHLKPWPTREGAAESRERSAVRINVKRSEIVYVPGSYHIVLGELTKNIRVRVEEVPDDIEVEIKRSYDPKGKYFEQEGKDEMFHSGVVLPGQSINLLIKKKEPGKPSVAPTPCPPPAAATPSPTPPRGQ